MYFVCFCCCRFAAIERENKFSVLNLKLIYVNFMSNDQFICDIFYFLLRSVFELCVNYRGVWGLVYVYDGTQYCVCELYKIFDCASINFWHENGWCWCGGGENCRFLKIDTL